VTLFTALSVLAAVGWAISAVLALRALNHTLAAAAGALLVASIALPFFAGQASPPLLPFLLSTGAAIALPAALRLSRTGGARTPPASDLFDELPDPAVMWKRARGDRILLERVNRAARVKFGDPPASTPGSPVEEFYVHVPHMADAVREVFLSRSSKHVELLYASRKEELAKWVQADFVPISGDRVLTSIRDISDRKAAEQALSENEERLRRLYEVTFEGIGLTDNGVFIDANRQLADMLGERLPDLIGKRVADYIDPQSTAAITDSGDATGGVAFEHRARRKDGYSFPVEIRSRIVRFQGSELGVLVVRNISARRRSEQLLRESEENYRELAESITDVFFAADRDLAVTHWNKPSEYLTGITARDAVGRHLYDLLPHLRGSDTDVLLADTLRTREALTCVTSYQAPDRTVPVEVRTYPTRKGLAVFIEDITELQRVEDELKASLREKEVLLREIHHRVKNNLQIISSLLSLQAEHVTGERALEALQESQNRIRSMAIIHEQLYGTGNLGRIDFLQYIRDLTAHVFRSYSMQAGRVSLDLQLEPVDLGIDRAIPCGIIINELLTNCLKHAFHGREKGTIRVELGRVGEKGFRLVVADDGAGIPGGLDLAASPSLGLKLVRTLTDQLRAELKIHGGDGTTFEVIFPG
jgi:PAS domain S-box-containing protein